MKAIDQKKLKVDLLKVQAAKAEMEYIIAQRFEEIERLEMNVKKQEETEKMLLEKLQFNQEGHKA